MLEFLLVCAAAGLYFYWAFLRPRKPIRTVTGTARVVDGDGLSVNALSIRLAGIDAPEWNQDGGQRAKLALTRLVHGKEVSVKVYALASGRWIGVVRTERNGVSIDVGEYLVANGWAWNWPKYPPSYAKAQRHAKRQRLGLWKGKPIAPWKFRWAEKKGR